MAEKVKRLFLGGPWHEREVAIPQDDYLYRVPRPLDFTSLNEPRRFTPTATNYVRRRMAYPNTKQVRSVFVPEWWSDAEAREALVAYLMIKWVRESPDA